MDALNAIMILEGDVSATEEEMIDAMQSLIDSGLAYQLQGSYARMADAMVEAGYCSASAH